MIVQLQKTRVTSKLRGTLLHFFKAQQEVLFYETPVAAPLRVQGDVFFSTILLHAKTKKTSTNTPTRTQFQQFLSNPPLSSFKKLILSTSSLHQGLHTMSLAKLVPDGLKNQDCKRLRLCEPPPVPYVPKKDKVQEAVSTMKGLQLKIPISKDMTLNFPMWNSGTKEAMLMHLTVILDAIKKRGHFKAYKEAQALYVEKKEVVTSVKAVDPQIPRDGQTIPESSSCTYQHHLNVA
jgi:hypothetical protein